jgi:hypothetical protein
MSLPLPAMVRFVRKHGRRGARRLPRRDKSLLPAAAPSGRAPQALIAQGSGPRFATMASFQTVAA